MSKGTFAKLLPSKETSQKIASMIYLLNIENGVSERDLHITVVYSREECERISTLAVGLPIRADGMGFGFYKNIDGTHCLVLHIHSNDIHNLHMDCRLEGATHDYNTFTPHITLSYDWDMRRPMLGNNWLEYFENMSFNQFVIEPLAIDWSPTDE